MRLIWKRLENLATGHSGAVLAAALLVLPAPPTLAQSHSRYAASSSSAQSLPHYSSGQMMNMLDQVESNRTPAAGGMHPQYASAAAARSHMGSTMGSHVGSSSHAMGSNIGSTMGAGHSMPPLRGSMYAKHASAPGTSQGVYRMGVLQGGGGAGNAPQMLEQIKQRFSHMSPGGGAGGPGNQMQMVQQMLQKGGGQAGAMGMGANMGVAGQNMGFGGQNMGNPSVAASRAAGGGFSNFGQLGASAAKTHNFANYGQAPHQHQQSFIAPPMGTAGNGATGAGGGAPAGNGAGGAPAGKASMSDLQKMMDQQYGK